MNSKSNRSARFRRLSLASIVMAGAFLSTPMEARAQSIFFEGFEGLTLGPNVDEALAGAHVWTKTPPAGWVIDDSQVPGVGNPAQDGVTEWAGWSFANKNWWVQTAEGQRREEFSFGVGNVMIADPDEWDDATHAVGLLNSTIKTKSIPVAGIAANTLVLFYDSSWRPEGHDDGLPNFPEDENGPLNNQTGVILSTFDGTTNEIQRWTSLSDESTYHDHNPNESVIIPLNNPAGAQSLSLTFGMEKGANDWWWAVDNIAVGTPPFGVGVVADGVSFRVRIVEALGLTVDQSKGVILELDGQVVTATQVGPEEPFFIVQYSQAPQVFQPGTVHTVKVKYTSSANKAIEETFTFTAPGYTTATATPQSVTATITDAAWLTVDETKPIGLELDGTAVSGATVSRTDAAVTVRFTTATAFASLSSHNLKVTFATTAGGQVVDPVTFTAPEVTTIPATLATAIGTGAQPGMVWRTHQLDVARDTTIALAEQQLAGTLGASVHDTTGAEADGTFLVDFVNFDQGGGEAGNFKGSAEAPQDVADGTIPGIPGTTGSTDNIAGEARAFVEILTAGTYAMVVNSDDGFQVSAGTTNNPTQVKLGKFDGGRGADDTQFYFNATQPGVYLFRLLWFEGGSDANVEWFTVNADGSRALVGGTQTGALKAFRTRTVAEPGVKTTIARSGGTATITYAGTLKSASVITGPFVPVAGAASPHTVPITTGNQFFIAE